MQQTLAPSTSLLLHPKRYDPTHFDTDTRRLLQTTIDWFEQRGKCRLVDDYHGRVFYSDFLDFAAREGLFSTFLTPSAESGRDGANRWDLSRIVALTEILGFYSINYVYPWHVTMLGLGPVWQSQNTAARRRATEAIAGGDVAAIGISERAHGNDLYASDMVLTPDGGGGYYANGSKYYIGNGNCAKTVSVFGRIDGLNSNDRYVFFYADSTTPNYHVVKNIVPTQMFVAELRLQDYPIGADDILHTGEDAIDAARNVINVGKFNMCFAGIGIATHALYEAITHAHNRIIMGKRVTEFPHVRHKLVDAYARLIGMRLFSDRTIDYYRAANPDDRRYILYGAVTKVKAATEAETVVGLLCDVAGAKSFEADAHLLIAKTDVAALPKLEGSVAVNLSLILKFMPAYLLRPQEFEPVPPQKGPAEDLFLLNQGPARGSAKVRFHDWQPHYKNAADVPNVARFAEQAKALAALLHTASPADMLDQDVLFAVAELFMLVVYGHLILEQATIVDLASEVLDQIFDFLVRDFSSRAIELHGKPGSTKAQQQWALSAVRKPVVNRARFNQVWQQVVGLSDAYKMRP